MLANANLDRIALKMGGVYGYVTFATVSISLYILANVAPAMLAIGVGCDFSDRSSARDPRWWTVGTSY